MKKKVNGKVKDIPVIEVGMLGTSFMCKAHVNAFKQMEYIFWPPSGFFHLKKIVSRSKETVEEAAGRYGFDDYSTNWRDIIEDESISFFDNVAPNNVHAEPCIEAAKAGKAILCEKPLARDSEEAFKMLEAVNKYKVKNFCGYNYRCVPALVLAKKIIDDGKIGKIQHFRAQYIMDCMNNPDVPINWRLQKKIAGSGVLGDLSHIIDLSRWLCGEPGSIKAITKTFFKDRPLPDNPSKRGRVDVDDAYIAAVEFLNGAIGSFEGSRCSSGRKNYEYIEINGELGSIYFNLENLNFLHVYLHEDESEGMAGFRAIDVTEYHHPYMNYWWCPGHIIGWENIFVHQAYEIINEITGQKKGDVKNIATFEDGYKALVICDAIQRASKNNKKEKIKYLI